MEMAPANPMFFGKASDGFTVRIANDVREAASLIEPDFEYVTGEYGDGVIIQEKQVTEIRMVR